MFSHDLIIGIRNILLLQLVMIVMMPGHLLLVRQELIKIWKSINTPFYQKRATPKKRSKFWEIDMTKFEP
jgi:hypothetical protein